MSFSLKIETRTEWKIVERSSVDAEKFSSLDKQQKKIMRKIDWRRWKWKIKFSHFFFFQFPLEKSSSSYSDSRPVRESRVGSERRANFSPLISIINELQQYEKWSWRCENVRNRKWDSSLQNSSFHLIRKHWTQLLLYCNINFIWNRWMGLREDQSNVYKSIVIYPLTIILKCRVQRASSSSSSVQD